VEGQGAERDVVGDWLVGMCTRVGEEFSLADATADYKKMVADLDEAGPLTHAAFMAQAYGVASSGLPASSTCRPTRACAPSAAGVASALGTRLSSVGTSRSPR